DLGGAARQRRPRAAAAAGAAEPGHRARRGPGGRPGRGGGPATDRGGPVTGTVMVLVEPEEGRLGLVSREALTFARQLGDRVHALVLGAADERSEERRVGKECRSRWWT